MSFQKMIHNALPDPRKIIHDLDVDESQPGTLLRDVDCLLGFMKEHKLAASGHYHFFPSDRLVELNNLLTKPTPYEGNRPQQHYFHQLHGLYLLLRCSGLLRVSQSKNRFLEVDPNLDECWRNMNGQSRYASLLEAWLLKGFDMLFEMA